MRSDLEIDYVHDNPPPPPDPETLDRDALVKLVHEKDQQIHHLSSELERWQMVAQESVARIEERERADQQAQPLKSQLAQANDTIQELRSFFFFACYLGGCATCFFPLLKGFSFFGFFLMVFCGLFAGFFIAVIVAVTSYLQKGLNMTASKFYYPLACLVVPAICLLLSFLSSGTE